MSWLVCLVVFLPQGTMSGGGNKVVKGRMGSSIRSDVSPDQLEAMEETLEKETRTAEVQIVWTQCQLHRRP